jgi:CP family cyanate transporter-like MFS transporter
MMLCAGYSLGCLTPVLAGLGRDLAGNYQVPFMVITGLALVMCVIAWRLGQGRR